MSTPNLAESYSQYFKAIHATSDDLLNESFRIRYEVYAEEFGFEDTNRFPDKMEVDEYDAHSIHCLFQHKPTGIYAGCVRLVRANPQKPELLLPFEQHVAESLDRQKLDPAQLPRDSFGEISRLAVRNSFRRRSGEQKHPNGLVNASEMRSEEERRTFPHIALGLYMAVASVGLDSGLDGVFAVMEPRLARSLRFLGIHFDQVGDVVDYHGPRATFYTTREQLFAKMSPPVMELLKAIQADLRL